jgi:two-component system sensor histidine kinase MprB
VTRLRSFRSKFGHLSFRARLGTFIALAVGFTVALAAIVSYFTVRDQLYSQTDSTLVGDLSTSAFSPTNGALSLPFVEHILRSNGGFLEVIDTSGNVIPETFYSGAADVNPDTAPLQPSAQQVAVASRPVGSRRIDDVTYDGEPYRVITQSFTLAQTGDNVAVLVGRPLSDIDHTLSTLGLILWLVTLGGIAIAVGLGYLVGRQTLRPVAALTEAAEWVAATQDLSSTIEVNSDDELGRLARSFNAMLVALSSSRDQQAQLISDAGHELRTPLTSLRTNIEVLMRVPDLPGPDRTDLYADVEAQLQELTSLIGDLVDMARQEERQPEPIEVRLDSIVAAAVERARRRAPGLVFDTHLTAGSVRAQPALLERAILNVLDNAAKWSPPGSVVDVWLQRGAIWTLDVHDQGPGIAPEDLPHVFDRFYRAETARSMPGSGLGLAIVAQVVAQHGGSVSAAVPPEGGTVVHVELPTVAEDEVRTPAEDPTAWAPSAAAAATEERSAFSG